MSAVLRMLRGQFGLLLTLNPLAKTAMTDVSTHLIKAMQDSISEPDSSIKVSAPLTGGSPHCSADLYNTAPCPRGLYPPLMCSCCWFPRAAGRRTAPPLYCGPHRCSIQSQACASPQGCRPGKRFWRCPGGEAVGKRGSEGSQSSCWGYCCRCGGIPPQCSCLASSASTFLGSQTAPEEKAER